ncbi:uracil-DNA glycosylase [Hyphococcus sp.]|uniref:uracil-DNA glycosylase n=1 Tax=Hyphococcus sp. TaxID=2038636 RepID=UPI002087375C|nr:MAG: uracil-DNA glycosylase [Marinicaulis sp.]
MIDLVNQISEPGWREVLAQESDKDYFKTLRTFLSAEAARGAEIFPPSELMFAAFNLTPFSNVKVVILGQDPYHGKGQAMGLAFSVPAGEKNPPSLRNIFSEINNDLGGPLRENGDLTDWAMQGVLLLNTVLTVERGKAAAHAGKGWESLTKAAISTLNKKRQGVVYLLWGVHAQKYADLIDMEKNTVLTAPHPSPLSSYRGFFGCGHFSKTNDILSANGESGILWAG